MYKELISDTDLMVCMDRPCVLKITHKDGGKRSNRSYSYSWNFIHSPSGKIARWTMIFHVAHWYVVDPYRIMEEALNVLSGGDKYRMVIY